MSVISAFTNAPTTGQGISSLTPQGFQTFTLSSRTKLYSAKMYLNKVGSPNGNFVYKIYNITGTPGTNANPTGSALLTSTQQAASTVSASPTYTQYELFFTTGTSLAAGTYALVVEYLGSSTSALNLGMDGPSTGPAGQNAGYYTASGGAWTNFPTYDAPYYIYSDDNTLVTTATISPSAIAYTAQGVATFSGVSFATLRAGAGNQVDPTFTFPSINSDAVGRTNLFTTISRDIMTFNTATLPAAAVITGARLVVGGNDKGNALGSQDLYVTSSSPASNTSIASTDYATVGSTSFGSITYGSFATGGTNSITLNSSGLAAINASGYTKLAVRIGSDFLNSAPTWSAAQSSYYDTRSGSSPYARLQVDYDLTQTPQTQTGKANIKNDTQRTQTGVGSIAGTYELAPWGFAVPGMTFWGDSPLAFQDIITNQSQTGKARITATTTKTQQGVARIQKSATQTQTGKSRITIVTSQTQTGKSRITVTTSRAQTGILRIEKSVSRTQTGLARIQKTVSQTQTGKGYILAAAVQKTQDGKASILVTQPRTQTGKARISVTVQHTQTGVSRITVVTQKTQTGKGRIQTTVQKTQTGKSAILVGTQRIITGKSRIQVTVQRTQQGTGRIEITTTKTITGKSLIQYVQDKTISGKANIYNPTLSAGRYVPGTSATGDFDEAPDLDGSRLIPGSTSVGSFNDVVETDGGRYIPVTVDREQDGI